MPERARNSYTMPPPARAGEAPNPNQSIFRWTSIRYVVPNVDTTNDPEYTDSFSDHLVSGGSTTGTNLPSDIRINRREPAGPGSGATYTQVPWVNKRVSEERRRNQNDHWETMWTVRQNRTPRPNMPIWNQDRPPTRPTANYSPTGYYFQRPWHIPRNAADALGPNATLHFSLADHRRKYEIYGQRPQGRLGVNTYRADPKPWDENLVIAPPAGAKPQGIAGNRSWRL